MIFLVLLRKNKGVPLLCRTPWQRLGLSMRPEKRR